VPKKSHNGPRPFDCVVVTGLSGAGKSVTLRALEDLGYFCVDNLPRLTRIAVGVDVRTGLSAAQFRQSLQSLRREGYSARVLFLDSDNTTLLRRFSETRRRHPLGGSVQSSVRRERRALRDVKVLADKLIDTSRLSPNEVKEVVVKTLGIRHPHGMAVVFLSFGYKYGVPLDADLVWDVRFLPNPNWVPKLRPLNGTSRSVSRYVLKNPDTQKFMAMLQHMMDFLLQRFTQEGKSYLTVAVGCTGGRHRSVAIAEALAGSVEKKAGFAVRVPHRDMARHG
jgi:RNase adapter protein RapZ